MWRRTITRTMRRGGGAAAAGTAAAGGAVATVGADSDAPGVAASAHVSAVVSGACIALIIRTVEARLPPVTMMRVAMDA